jgi:triosephosphate isomerase
MKYFIANWKMHKTYAEAISFIEFFKGKNFNSDITIIIAPPFTLLWPLSKHIEDTKLKLSAQNMYFEEKGAFTGEVSPIHLKDSGVEYVIIGHSERRNIFKEDDELISKKLKSAFTHNLIPIFCIGETLEQRQKGVTFDVLANQLKVGFSLLSKEEITNTIIAYEPVWAIGTGINATPKQVEEVHLFIQNYISKNYFQKGHVDVKILYGGSVNQTNIYELMEIKKIDGVLVGGASLNADVFEKIICYKGCSK